MWMSAFYFGAGTAECPALNPTLLVDVDDDFTNITVNDDASITVSDSSITVSDSGTVTVEDDADITPICIHN